MENISDYKRIEFELHEYLVQLRDMLMLLKASEHYLKKLDSDIEYIKTKCFKVAVIGEFKRGKSSLINALLGADILPSDVTPTTATINRIVYGSKAAAVLYYKDGTTRNSEIDQLTEYVTKLTNQSDEQAGRIKEAVITYPVEICRNNIEIIDTPGLNDDERMTEVTLDMLEYVDAAIVTISAVSPVSQTEQSLITQLIRRKNIGTIIFVVTFIDQIEEEDRERLYQNIKQRISKDTFRLLQEDKEEVVQKAHTILDEIKLYGVSSKLALKAISMNKQSLMKDSGFDTFRTALYQILISEQGIQAIKKSIQSIDQMVEENKQQYERNKAEYKNLLTDAEELIRLANIHRETYSQTLDKGFAAIDISMNNTFMEFQGLKRKLLQPYITELSNLKANTDQDIRNAILRAFAKCKEYIIDSEMTAIHTKIAIGLTTAIRTYQEKCYQLINNMKLHQVDINQNQWKLPLYHLSNDNIFKPIKTPDFTLTITPLSIKMNLTGYNVINDIKADINKAIEVHISNWGLFLRQFRLWCFSQAKMEASLMIEFLNQQGAELAKNYQKMLQVNEANYEVSCKVSEELLRKTEIIKEEMKIQ